MLVAFVQSGAGLAAPHREEGGLFHYSLVLGQRLLTERKEVYSTIVWCWASSSSQRGRRSIPLQSGVGLVAPHREEEVYSTIVWCCARVPHREEGGLFYSSLVLGQKEVYSATVWCCASGSSQRGRRSILLQSGVGLAVPHREVGGLFCFSLMLGQHS